MARRLLF
jgi:hypothetical protein